MKSQENEKLVVGKLVDIISLKDIDPTQNRRVSPIIFLVKKGGALRSFANYIRLNEVTIMSFSR